jgi:hypothetical protein
MILGVFTLLGALPIRVPPTGVATRDQARKRSKPTTRLDGADHRRALLNKKTRRTRRTFGALAVISSLKQPN